MHEVVKDILTKLDDWEAALVYAYTPNNWGVIRKDRLPAVKALKEEVQAAVKNLGHCGIIQKTINKT